MAGGRTIATPRFRPRGRSRRQDRVRVPRRRRPGHRFRDLAPGVGARRTIRRAGALASSGPTAALLALATRHPLLVSRLAGRLC